MPSENTITTLIFDLGQVIVSFDHMELCRRASKHSHYEPEEIFARIFHSGLMHRFETGSLTPDAFYHDAF